MRCRALTLKGIQCKKEAITFFCNQHKGCKLRCVIYKDPKLECMSDVTRETLVDNIPDMITYISCEREWKLYKNIIYPMIGSIQLEHMFSYDLLQKFLWEEANSTDVENYLLPLEGSDSLLKLTVKNIYNDPQLFSELAYGHINSTGFIYKDYPIKFGINMVENHKFIMQVLEGISNFPGEKQSTIISRFNRHVNTCLDDCEDHRAELRLETPSVVYHKKEAAIIPEETRIKQCTEESLQDAEKRCDELYDLSYYSY